MKETKKYYYETGEIKKEIEYEDGEMNLYTTFHINGQLECRSNFLNGKKEGTTEMYYSNGQLESDIQYHNDFPIDGPYTIFLDDGSVWEKGILKNQGQEVDLSIDSGKPSNESFEVKEDNYEENNSDKIQDWEEV